MTCSNSSYRRSIFPGLAKAAGWEVTTILNLSIALLVATSLAATLVPVLGLPKMANAPSHVCPDRNGREVLPGVVPAGAFTMLGRPLSARHELGDPVQTGKGGGGGYAVFRFREPAVRLSVGWTVGAQIETVAVTSVDGRRLFDVGDSKGVLLGDSRGCLGMLRGVPFSSADGVLRYHVGRIVHFYVLNRAGRIDWIGDTLGDPYLPPFVISDFPLSIMNIVGIVMLVLALYLIWRSLVYLLGIVSRFDYLISRGAFTMRQRLFGLLPLRSRSIAFSRIEAMEVISQSSAAPFWAFSMLRPGGLMFGAPRARVDGVEVFYRGRGNRLRRLTTYPDDASALVAQFRSISAAVHAEPDGNDRTPGG